MFAEGAVAKHAPQKWFKKCASEGESLQGRQSHVDETRRVDGGRMTSRFTRHLLLPITVSVNAGETLGLNLHQVERAKRGS